jgi:branched-subunit amino acid permease
MISTFEDGFIQFHQFPDVITLQHSDSVTESTMQDESISHGPPVGCTTAFLVFVFATIYATTHHRFRTEKQKSYILSTISSGCMSALSLWFVWTWFKGSDGGDEKFSFERVVAEGSDLVARYGTVFFRSYLIGMSSVLTCFVGRKRVTDACPSADVSAL